MQKAVLVLFLAFAVIELNAIPPEMRAILPPEIVDFILGLRKICTAKIGGLTDADIETYKITNTDEKFKCYMKCMLHEAKWMSPDGTIHYEHILDGMHADVKPILEEIFEKCRDIPDSPEECGKAYNFHVCIAKADPKRYFLP
ncbi:PREDICTED: general odorant-binding protein 83a-like [Nicrophorus vespilloides]|uniref:General odorant-binding protein 83a-like n=1 Tax=Nicrophorus vespilloides TaxID=110193 RepID=A0ABM1MJV6_NICVS|nr:PREDICTED: general odorant-binding protein 83a-like [Nicrophorus vespilloides]